MIEAGWSARRVARQLGRSDCVVRRCLDQWIRELSFTRRPGSERSDRQVVEKTTTSCAARDAHPSTPPFGVVPRSRKLNAAEWNHVVFSDEPRFNFSSDDNCVRVWRPRGECLNPAFALQRHTAPTAGGMVWGAIAYNKGSPLVLIHGTMTAQRYAHDILQPHVLALMQRLPGPIFQQDNARPHTARVLQDCLRTVTTLSWPARSPDLSTFEHIGDRLGRRVAAFHEFERTRGKVTANMERNVSRHHSELVCLNARSYRIMHSSKGVQQGINSFILFHFSLK
ncbi:transposable element Tcb2 transposase [Trichonephila clavipes]|nr:transposable element Tcb2 transposase [Trichonephila clavipes]